MDKINFEDLPSEKTPINAQNLNQVQTNTENAINQVQTNTESALALKADIAEIKTGENGTTIKYTNGIMVQTVGIKKNVDVSTPKGGLYVGESISLGFYPESFTTKPIQIVSVDSPSGYSVWQTGVISNDNHYIGTTDLLRAGSPAGKIDVVFNILAIGRWK